MTNEIKNMKLGYEYIRDRIDGYRQGLLTYREFIMLCMGYIQALEDTGLITYSQRSALNDMIFTDDDEDVLDIEARLVYNISVR